MWTVASWLLKGLKRMALGPILLIVEGIWWLIQWFFKGSAWMFMVIRSYTVVSTILKFVHYPIMISIMLLLINYLFTDYQVSFLNDLSVRDFLSNMIDTYPFIQRFIYVGYQIGLWQAGAILFYFLLIRFALKLLLKMFGKIGL
jgi:hypothetical protein